MIDTKSLQFQKNLSKLESYIFNFFNTVVLILIAVYTLYPFWNTVVISLNDASDTIRGGAHFWPRVFTLYNYKAVFVAGTIGHAFLVSVSRTFLTTVLNVLLTSMLAYTLGRPEYKFRKPMTFIVVLTMYINAGMIPGYFLIKSLGLINNFLVYVVPGMIGAFTFILVRTYMNALPDSFIESARMDGASEYRIFFSVILPLCKPVLATVALLVAVGNWNAWFDTKLYASGRQNLSTLTYELMKFLQASQSQSKSAADIGAMGMARDAASSMVTPMAIRAAVTVIVAAPILVVYPFLQKYFVVGLTVGGVKE
jgi:putative aldouronate transport system permease protein